MPIDLKALSAQNQLPYKAAVRMQRLLVAAAEKEKVSPTELAAVARAWDVLEERKRVMKMRPAPKAIDTTRAKSQPRRPDLAPILSAPEPEKPQAVGDEPLTPTV